MKILICDYAEPMDRDLDIERGYLYNAFGRDLEIDCFIYDGNAEHFYGHLADADVLMTAYLDINEEVLSHAPKLKMISVEANGYNSIDIKACEKFGVGVTCIEEYCTDEVADHTLTLALAVIRKLNEYQNDMRNLGVFNFNARSGLFKLSGKTWGIVGLGKIGKAVAKRALAFGCKVVAFDPYANEDDAIKLGALLVSKETLLQSSHIISLHAGDNEDTHHIISKENIAKMQNKPVIVNVARGGLVCEKDLIEALDSGKIFGAGLDVFESEETENMKKSPFLKRNDVVISPHIAFYSDDSIKECGKITSENIIYYMKGEFDKVKKIIYKGNLK